MLTRNRSGHYVFDGEINRHKVTFLVDTGATTTAIPGRLQRSLGLEAGPRTQVSTANGVTTAYLTRLDKVSFAPLPPTAEAPAAASGFELLGTGEEKVFQRMISERNRIAELYRSQGKGESAFIRGEIKKDEVKEGAKYHIREHRSQSFSRSLTLPSAVVADKANAEMKNGILTLTLPKAEESKPKVITVKAR